MEFVTRSPKMQSVLDQAQLLAPGGHPVLIRGEAGTGKERLAHFLHARSDRAGGPFMRVDCAAVPADRLEAELFECAPPGGNLARAVGGTLFLAEVGELPLPVQARLVPLLEPNSSTPAGGTELPPRILASTSADLAVRKEQGLFLANLFRKLGALQLTLPPLRERKEDLEILTQEILAAAGAPPVLSAEAISALLLHDWPGNIPELQSALKRALRLAGPGAAIELRHLPPEVAVLLQPPPPRQLFRRYMHSAELLLIRWALAACVGDRTRTARFLGLSRAALYKKLKLYPEFRAEP